MKIKNINIGETLKNAEELLEADKQISSALKAMFKLLITIITLLSGRLSLNSRNSSKPPSSDPNKEKKNRNKGTKNKPGGQPGRVGVNLKPVDDPDKIITIKCDKRHLPRGQYQ